MKFFCGKDTLLSLISTAARAVSSKSEIPLLEGLLLHAEADTLTITGYNLSIGIRTSIEANITEPGQAVLNAKLLLDIIRKLPPETVYVETNPDLRTTIKCGSSVFNLIATEADEYPALADVSEETGFSLPQAVLKSMIAQTLFSVSDNTSKPILTGCLFEFSGDKLHIVAVDGYRLSIRRETTDTVASDLKFVVPGASLREVERILTEEDGTVSIFPDQKNILFRIQNTTLITRLIDGEFLNYRAAIPTSFAAELKVDRHKLIAGLERVSLIVNEKLKTPVRFHFTDSCIQMSCMTALGKSYDECPCDNPGCNLEIGFNNRYILDALRAANDDTLLLKLNGPLNPVIITPPEGDRYTYLVLPVRLKGNE